MKRLQHRPGHFGFVAEPAYLQKKLEDHRTSSAAMFALFACLEPALWAWDYVTDPAGAQDTLMLRLLYFPLFMLVAASFRFVKHRRLLALVSMGATLLAEALFVEILNRLQSGMVYGIGGFMFFIFMPLVLFQGFSLRLNLAYTFVAASLPHLLADAGFAHHFLHRHYAVLIWPSAVMVMLVQFNFALSYLRRRESETALQEASNTDPLTGASNRRHFMPLLHQEIIRCRRLKHPVSLLMIDIDHFKKINDSYGHPVGDLAICQLADVCRACSRKIDSVARLGGEEFAILLPETSQDEALQVAERVRKTAQETPVKTQAGQEIRFTVSIGVAEWPEGEELEDKLISLADRALYQAKSEGRNRVVAHAKPGGTPY